MGELARFPKMVYHRAMPLKVLLTPVHRFLRSIDSSKESRLIWSGLIYYCLIVCSFWSTSQPAEATVLDTIESVWRSREERAKTFSFTWVETEVIGNRSRLQSYPANPERAPEQDISAEMQATLILSGNDRYSYRRVGPRWLNSGKYSSRTTYVNARLNGITTSLHDHGNDAEYPTAFLTLAENPSRVDIKARRLSALTLTYRPSNPAIHNFRKEDWHVLATNAQLESGSCIVIERSTAKNSQHSQLRQKSSNSMRIWIDMDRACSIKRVVWVHGLHASEQIDVMHKKDSAETWIPISWRYSQWADGKGPTLKTSAEARVTAYEFNRNIFDDEFSVSIPPGTWLVDIRDEQKRRDYVVREDGKWREIILDEVRRGAGIADFMVTPPGYAKLGSSGKWQNSFWAWGVISLACAAVISLIIHRFRSRSRRVT